MDLWFSHNDHNINFKNMHGIILFGYHNTNTPTDNLLVPWDITHVVIAIYFTLY